jgi:hypothetical protein
MYNAPLCIYISIPTNLTATIWLKYCWQEPYIYKQTRCLDGGNVWTWIFRRNIYISRKGEKSKHYVILYILKQFIIILLPTLVYLIIYNEILYSFLFNHIEKTEGQSRMENQDRLIKYGHTRHRTKANTTPKNTTDQGKLKRYWSFTTNSCIAFYSTICIIPITWFTYLVNTCITPGFTIDTIRNLTATIWLKYCWQAPYIYKQTKCLDGGNVWTWIFRCLKLWGQTLNLISLLNIWYPVPYQISKKWDSCIVKLTNLQRTPL